MEINLVRHLEVLMPEAALDFLEVHAVFAQFGGVGVAQAVEMAEALGGSAAGNLALFAGGAGYGEASFRKKVCALHRYPVSFHLLQLLYRSFYLHLHSASIFLL